MIKKIGQISITVVMITASGTLLASIFGAWATASRETSAVREKVGIIAEREANHYKEIQKQLKTIDEKLDKLLSK